VITDSFANVYISDMYNHRVRKVSATTGLVTTVAGTGSATYNGDGIAATSATLYYQRGIALDTSGNLFIADCQNQRIRQVSFPSGIISTVAGTGTAGYNGDNMWATSAYLYYPYAVLIDASSKLYIGEYNGCRVRRVSGGIITTFAGTGSCTSSGDGGAATSAALSYPSSLAFDSRGNMLIATPNSNQIRTVNMASGIISTYMGGTSAVFPQLIGAAAFLSNPYGVNVDKSGTVYISDVNNNRIITVANKTGSAPSVLIGSSLVAGSTGDGGPASVALLNQPISVGSDSFGNIYIADYINHKIRYINGKVILCAVTYFCGDLIGMVSIIVLSSLLCSISVILAIDSE
jgi:trimeric autotransporter adhesin